MPREASYLRNEAKPSLGTLQRVTPKVRRSDGNLKRYYAYRCKVWKAQNPDADWKILAARLGLDPAALIAFRFGRNGSPGKVGAFARGLGPDSEDLFKKLARDWADKYPTWEEKDPLPERIEFTGDALLDGAEGSVPMHSDDLRAAVRALPGLMPCTPDEAKIAGEMAWKANGEAIGDWYGWLGVLRGYVDKLRRGSGERPSSKHRLGS